MSELFRIYRKIEFNTRFQQKFATGSYGVEIGRAWCSRKACEICSSLIQKKKLKKIYFSSHKLPKQHSTSFWSQGILGVKGLKLHLVLDLGSSYLVLEHSYFQLQQFSNNSCSNLKLCFFYARTSF
jgi:hypothetical protein